MGNDIWDRPPIPEHGDDSDDTTFAGVGRVVTEWEHVELEFSYLYSLFVGKHEALEALREYGEGAVFTHRVDKLVKAHEKFCPRIPDQDLEVEFFRLIDLAKKFSDRRNDVAHGVVRPIQWTRPPPHSWPTEDDPFQYCLVPPNYKGKHFAPDNLPAYVYTYDEMLGIQGQLYGVCGAIVQYRYKLKHLLEQNERKRQQSE
jgi:hypothetical protein